MLVQTWTDVLQRSFQDLWFAVVQFVPNIIFAVALFVIGWVVGSVLGRVVAQVVKATRVDNALKNAGFEDAFRRAGMNFDIAGFLGGLVQWFIIAVFLLASLELLHLDQVSLFLQQVVLLYIPQVIIAILILLLAAVIAEVAKNVVMASARAVGAHSVNLLGSITKWSIWILAVLTALSHLGIAGPFVQTLFTGIVIALSLGFGLAFGLGGQEAAARYIEKVRKEVAGHK
jgi:hypothetical protein